MPSALDWGQRARNRFGRRGFLAGMGASLAGVTLWSKSPLDHFVGRAFAHGQGSSSETGLGRNARQNLPEAYREAEAHDRALTLVPPSLTSLWRESYDWLTVVAARLRHFAEILPAKDGDGLKGQADSYAEQALATRALLVEAAVNEDNARAVTAHVTRSLRLCGAFASRLGVLIATGRVRTALWPALCELTGHEAEHLASRLERLGRGEQPMTAIDRFEFWPRTFAAQARLLGQALNPSELDAIRRSSDLAKAFESRPKKPGDADRERHFRRVVGRYQRYLRDLHGRLERSEIVAILPAELYQGALRETSIYLTESAG